MYANYYFNESNFNYGVDTFTGPLVANTQVVIQPQGQTQAGGSNLYLVSACAMEYSDPDVVRYFGGGDVPLPPAWLQIQGQPLTNNITTNADGTIWGHMLLAAAAGVPANVTPVATHVFTNNVYSFNAQATPVIFQLTALSNSATQIDATNWAAVKTNDYVTFQAVLSDTNLIPMLTWNGGQAVPGNPLQRQISKAVSAVTTVTATLGPSNITAKVWVIWATVNVLMSGANPSNAPSFVKVKAGPINQLGLIYVTNVPTAPQAQAQVCIVGNVTPQGVNNLKMTNWGVTQMRFARFFQDGAINGIYGVYDTTWTCDGVISPFYTPNLDSSDNVYGLDAPSIGRFAINSSESYANFYDFITWNGQACSATNSFWYWQGRWKADQTPQITLTNVGYGAIDLPSAPFYPAP